MIKLKMISVIGHIEKSKTPNELDKANTKCEIILLKPWQVAQYKVSGRFTSFRKRTMDILSKKRQKLFEKDKQSSDEEVLGIPRN